MCGLYLVCVCLSVCMHACICLWCVCMCMCKCVGLCMCKCVGLCMCKCVGLCMCKCVGLSLSVWVTFVLVIFLLDTLLSSKKYLWHSVSFQNSPFIRTILVTFVLVLSPDMISGGGGWTFMNSTGSVFWLVTVMTSKWQLLMIFLMWHFLSVLIANNSTHGVECVAVENVLAIIITNVHVESQQDVSAQKMAACKCSVIAGGRSQNQPEF